MMLAGRPSASLINETLFCTQTIRPSFRKYRFSRTKVGMRPERSSPIRSCIVAQSSGWVKVAQSIVFNSSAEYPVIVLKAAFTSRKRASRVRIATPTEVELKTPRSRSAFCLRFELRFFDRLKEARIVDCNRRLRGHTDDQALRPLGKNARLGMAEEESADHFAGTRNNRHGQVAAHRQVSARHSMMRRVFTVTGIGQNIGKPDGAFAAERRIEQWSVSGKTELIEGFAGRSGEGV